MHLHLVFHAGMVAQLRFLAGADEFLDVKPITAEDGGVVRHRVILQPGCREAHQHGKLAVLGALLRQSVPARSPTHQHFKVPKRVFLVEQLNHLDVFRRQTELTPPVGVEHMVDAPPAVCLFKAAVARLFVAHLHNLLAVAAHDNHCHGKEEILHVGGLLQEKLRKRVLKHPSAHLCVGCRCAGLGVVVAQAVAVAGQHVE